ncbi:hypothetical protein F4703DRAFT_1476280 [Phycomyces blakesleeanus]
MAVQKPTTATKAVNGKDTPSSKGSPDPERASDAKADDDNEDEPVEKGVKGEASKDMKNVTGYVNEELTSKQVDSNKVAKSLAFIQEAAKAHKQKTLAKHVSSPVNKQDVEFLVAEMQVSKAEAEKALRDKQGDVVGALNELIEN